ncbi:DUF4189 domain-containing protein [Xanthomonas axonopodis pv. vasculorum]|uniref:DUF4189 domain-containing protein n=1 Tax=Xanthomonas axonopodis TaxID=53413 RepID=UPI000D49644B|nr:DUF4189 domain-containing protein [Xanthomonas axonopodis]PPV05210.1 hypothetical protein XavaCFBP5823_21000 [Xanthomonas axonopodis pv. vasculorum]QKD86449.1 DUF4189 domain-containing protein [Xanthomonas axonopodis pv. vasculorum]
MMKHKVRWFLPMLAILFCANAWAEQGCPPGMIPGGVDPHNMATCAPIPQGSSQQQSDQQRRPAGKWLKTWGAIAENDNGSDFGVSTGKLSKTDAENEAVKNCEKGIEKKCRVIYTYKNQCVAVAEPNGKGVVISASGPSQEETSYRALTNCKKENPGAECTLGYTNCTEQIFKWY